MLVSNFKRTLLLLGVLSFSKCWKYSGLGIKFVQLVMRNENSDIHIRLMYLRTTLLLRKGWEVHTFLSTIFMIKLSNSLHCISVFANTNLKTRHLSAIQNTKKSTSWHIFEKVLICIERGMYSGYFKEMNLFKKLFFEKGVFFLPASWAVPIL